MSYSSKIDVDAGFCNDRTPTSGTGMGTSATNYVALTRLNTNKTPSLLCQDVNDIFKTPVGLITIDEVTMGGIVYDSSKTNTTTYLYTNSNYWTISPFKYNNGAYMFYVFYGQVGAALVNGFDGVLGVRPVINLKSDTLFEDGGTGETSTPYVIIGT